MLQRQKPIPSPKQRPLRQSLWAKNAVPAAPFEQNPSAPTPKRQPNPSAHSFAEQHCPSRQPKSDAAEERRASAVACAAQHTKATLADRGGGDAAGGLGPLVTLGAEIGGKIRWKVLSLGVEARFEGTPAEASLGAAGPVAVTRFGAAFVGCGHLGLVHLCGSPEPARVAAVGRCHERERTHATTWPSPPTFEKNGTASSRGASSGAPDIMTRRQWA